MNQRTKVSIFFLVLLFIVAMAGCRASDCGCPMTELMSVEEEAKLT